MAQIKKVDIAEALAAAPDDGGLILLLVKKPERRYLALALTREQLLSPEFVGLQAVILAEQATGVPAIAPAPSPEARPGPAGHA